MNRARITTGDLEKRNFTEAAEKRNLRTTTGQRVNYYTTTKQVAPQQKFQTLSVDNIFGFSIELPEGFDKKSDTLTATSGSVEFKTDNTIVRITALGNVCEGGSVFLQNCLNIKSDAFTDVLRKKYVSSIVEQKEVVKLRDSINNRFDEGNAGKQFIIDVGTEKIAVLTFFDPNMKYLWRMEVIAPDNEAGILNQGGVLNRIKESLFQEEDTSSAASYVSRIVKKYRSTAKLMSASKGRRRNISEVVSSKEDVVYKADGVGFQISIPASFTETEDSLRYDGGEMQFVNDDGEIVVIAIADTCVSQTDSIVRKCIESQADLFFQDLKKEYKGMTSLGVNNYQLRLTSNMTNMSVARGEILMKGLDRVGEFVFAEPAYGHVWKVRVVSDKGQKGLLGDSQKIKDLLYSMRFM